MNAVVFILGENAVSKKTFRTLRVVSVFAVTAIAFIYYTQSSSVGDEVKPIPTETLDEAVRGTMREKLAHSQLILNGLVTRDFAMLKDAAREMKTVSLSDPQQIAGDETDNELYDHFRLEFLRTCTLIERMADEKNLEGAAFAYQSLTANCLSCHSYLDQDEKPKSSLIR